MITNIFNIFNLKLDIEIPETVISFYISNHEYHEIKFFITFVKESI